MFPGENPGSVIVEFHVKVHPLPIKSLQKQVSGIGNLFVVAACSRYKLLRLYSHLLIYLAKKSIRVRLSLD